MSDEPVRIGVIGGSGLYNMPQLTDIERRHVDTPFGSPSDAVTIGKLGGVPVAFIPRHGIGHIYLPQEVPYRANIYALKMLGVRWVIGINACGSLREDYAPGHIVIPDQLFDNKRSRADHTFFGNGLVAHIGVADPFCASLSRLVADSVREAGGVVHEGGTSVVIEGPRFSTRAESHFFRQAGFSILSMTSSPEAFLAREAEMCYATMAHVTDYDVWHESKAPVTVEMVINTLHGNVEIARKAVMGLVAKLNRVSEPCEHENALASALMTARDKVTPEALQRLEAIVGKYYR